MTKLQTAEKQLKLLESALFMKTSLKCQQETCFPKLMRKGLVDESPQSYLNSHGLENSWVTRDVIAAMLDDHNKAFLI